MYVCISSVTLVHPAKTDKRNEMPFGRDTLVLDRSAGPPREGVICVSEPPVRSDAACRQITLARVIIAITLSIVNQLS